MCLFLWYPVSFASTDMKFSVFILFRALWILLSIARINKDQEERMRHSESYIFLPLLFLRVFVFASKSLLL